MGSSTISCFNGTDSGDVRTTRSTLYFSTSSLETVEAPG